MMSQGQFGTLTFVNPCMQSTKSTLRPLHDGVKTISLNSYTNEVNILYFNALKTNSNMAQGERIGSDM